MQAYSLRCSSARAECNLVFLSCSPSCSCTVTAPFPFPFSGFERQLRQSRARGWYSKSLTVHKLSSVRSGMMAVSVCRRGWLHRFLQMCAFEICNHAVTCELHRCISRKGTKQKFQFKITQYWASLGPGSLLNSSSVRKLNGFVPFSFNRNLIDI